jgi:hypothetical protein
MVRFNVLAVVAFAACLATVFGAEAPVRNQATLGKPAHVETTAGALKKVTLTPKAAKRLGIEIDQVRVDPSGRRIIPYSAVLYDLTGRTWVYVHADPMSFVREAVRIETIKGENVYLKDGPAPGTKVLATGVQQVFGTEVGVGH